MHILQPTFDFMKLSVRVSKYTHPGEGKNVTVGNQTALVCLKLIHLIQFSPITKEIRQFFVSFYLELFFETLKRDVDEKGVQITVGIDAAGLS